MTPDPASRRDNGLVAAEWAALVDVAPRLSAQLLVKLAEAGVAAYVEAAALLDERSLDRLWVDPGRAAAARTVVSALFAGLPVDDDPAALVRPVPRDSAERVLSPPVLLASQRPEAPNDDEIFRQIVAGYAATAPEPPTRRAVREEGDGAAEPPRRRRTDPPAADASIDPLPAWLEPDELEPEAEDHFIPPPPPPLRWFQPRTLLAALGIVLGLLAVFAPALVQLPDSNGSRVLGMVLLASGAGALVWWMRDRTDGPDDGAVV
ncbi:MAG: uncharacterized protein JWL64_785 [Frankiales bacterium]|nr:uncharacterized protein [Frankiales bacterium]